ncbi:hypothetical protein HID58_075462 [Brassica napus]|uniref:RNase H type-1 domain-containing protein n=1 Tax=Brassica napus TaxID=3708 RepID=A0ABQ7YMV9_BRANA|nr:hypothetical protein HID58_075462 [Brassica napus]
MPLLIEHPVVPPGFAPLFPEMPQKERDMALQYISHSDPTERQARITRVQQSLQPGFEDNLGSAPRISHDINKGKGHVFNFQEHDRPGKRVAVTRERSAFSEADLKSVKDRTSFPSDNLEVSSSSSSLGPTVFRVGTSTDNLSTGANEAVKKSRRRPQRWKRICSQRPSGQAQDLDHTGKRDSPVGDGEESTATLGVEEIVKLGWGVDASENETPLLERINRCRRELAKWKRVTTGREHFSEGSKGNIAVEYRTDEVDLTLKVSDLIDERHGTWDVQRVWHLFVGEDANQILEMRPQLNRHDTMVWGFSRNDANRNCGVAWLTRNHLGVSLIHSRRSYSMVASQLEAELLSFLWVAESLSTLRHKNVVFESSSYLAGEAVLNPDNFPMFHGLIDVIREKLSRLQLWSIAYVQSGANQCTEAIARSVTRDQRYASYVGKDGPSWLLPMIHANAVRADNGY